MDRLKIFKRELEFIQNKETRNFVEKALKAADVYFFVIPASTTGKHHPPFDKKLGGLVRHSKVVACITNDICTAKEIPDVIKDTLVAAALLHDVKKLGSGKGGFTAKDHPECAVKFITELEHSKVPYFELLCRAVVTHMGQWGTQKPQNDTELIVHTADYLASRNTLLDYDFDGYEFDPQWLKEVVIPFGKHAGKTFIELSTDYIDWVLSQENFFNPMYQKLLKVFKKFNK